MSLETCSADKQVVVDRSEGPDTAHGCGPLTEFRMGDAAEGGFVVDSGRSEVVAHSRRKKPREEGQKWVACSHVAFAVPERSGMTMEKEQDVRQL